MHESRSRKADDGHACKPVAAALSNAHAAEQPDEQVSILRDETFRSCLIRVMGKSPSAIKILQDKHSFNAASSTHSARALAMDGSHPINSFMQLAQECCELRTTWVPLMVPK